MSKVGSRYVVAAIEKLPGIERDHAGGGRVALGAAGGDLKLL